MSNKYKHGDTIPESILYERAEELIKAITTPGVDLRHEYTMRIPAELDRDADLVLSQILLNSQGKDLTIDLLHQRIDLAIDIITGVDDWYNHGSDVGAQCAQAVAVLRGPPPTPTPPPQTGGE